MADTSERIIILSAVVLVIILWLPNSGLIRTSVTIDDLEVEIFTSSDTYTLGENFTANFYLVNHRTKDVWLEPDYSLSFTGVSENDPKPGPRGVNIARPRVAFHIPANSKAQILHLSFKPKYSGEFFISCLGANKTVLILDSEPEGAHARKSSFARGEIVAFNFESIFLQPDSYIKIYDPNSTLYWRTEAFVDSWWWLNGGLYAVPYNRQTAGGNPMILASDAPLGIWSWEWYDNEDVELDSGMFTVAGTLLVNETILDVVVVARLANETISDAEFELSNLQITEEEVEIGEEVEISFTIFNVGEETGSYSFSLMIEGHFVIETVEMVGVLGAGESETATHTLTLEKPGRYTVTTYGLTGSFVVGPRTLAAIIGVREGDWVEYSHTFHYERPDTRAEIKIFIYDYDYKTTVRILEVTDTNVTFEEDRRYLNGSIAWQLTITGNPNEPHYQHPFFRINDLFMPAGLEAGNYIPQTVSFPDSKDQYVSVPWTQYINETVEITFLGVKREVNHIYWNRQISGHTSDEKSTFEYYVERDGYYDKKTGVMLQWFYNYSKIVRRVDTGKESVLRGTYDYKVSDTNLWSVPLWVRREVQIATTTFLSLFVVFVTLWIKRDWLSKRIVGATNG